VCLNDTYDLITHYKALCRRGQNALYKGVTSYHSATLKIKTTFLGLYWQIYSFPVFSSVGQLFFGLLESGLFQLDRVMNCLQIKLED